MPNEFGFLFDGPSMRDEFGFDKPYAADLQANFFSVAEDAAFKAEYLEIRRKRDEAIREATPSIEEQSGMGAMIDASLSGEVSFQDVVDYFNK